MVERRVSALIAAAMVFLVSAVLWDVFFRQTHTGGGSRLGGSDSPTSPPVGGDTATTSAPAAQAPPPLPRPALTQPTGPTYMELFARSETRRRIRASAGTTYLNEVVVQSRDSMLHRWDNRILRPVRVHLAPGATPNFQTEYLDAVRNAFRSERGRGPEQGLDAAPLGQSDSPPGPRPSRARRHAELPDRVSRRRAQRLSTVAGRRSSRALQAGCGFGIGRSAHRVAAPVRNAAHRSDRSDLGRGRPPADRHRDARDVRPERAAPRGGRCPCHRAARDRAPHRAGPFIRLDGHHVRQHEGAGLVGTGRRIRGAPLRAPAGDTPLTAPGAVLRRAAQRS